MKNNKILIISFILLFIMSCDDNDYPSQLTNTENTFELTLSKIIEGGEIDYADYNYIDQTVITASLKICDADGSNCTSQNLPENQRDINFYWSISPEQVGAGSYMSYNNNQSQVLQNGSATIPAEGFLNLIWKDEGIQAENVTLWAQYTDILDNQYLSDTLNFEIRSIYETVNSLSALEYIIAEINNEDPENLSREGTIGAIVKNSASSIIQGVNVKVSPPNNIDPQLQDIYDLISFNDPDNTVTTNETGRAEFDFTLLVNQTLIDEISNNNATIQLDYILYVEDEKLIQAETNNICDLDTDNDGICEIQTSVTLTLTTEVFSIAGSLGSISMTVSPNSFTLDSNDPNLYEIEIYAEALTPDGGVLIPPEERTIEFNFSRTPEIGSITSATVNSSDGTASATLSGYFGSEENLGETITIQGEIIEDGSQLAQASNSVDIISQEALLVADIEDFALQISPSLVIANNPDTTFTINLNAIVLNENGGGIPNVNVHFQNNSDPLIGLFDSEIVTTNSTGQASTLLQNVTGSDIGQINISAYIVDPTNICYNTDGDYVCQTSATATITNDEQIAFALLESINVELTPSLLLFNDVPGSLDSDDSSDDTTATDNEQTENQISVQAYVKDANGSAIAGLPVNFSNLNTDYGTLSSILVPSGADGVAANILNNITPSDDSLAQVDIMAYVLNPTDEYDTVQVDVKTAIIGNQSVYNTEQVNNLDAVFLQNLSVVNNININYEDSLVAQVLDANNVPVSDVPVYFSLVTDDIGYLSSNIGWSDSLGITGTKFVITQADMQQPNDTVAISLNVFVSENMQTDITRTYVIQGSANIEDDVSEFHYYPLNPDTITLFANTNSGSSIQLPFITKDINGVRIEGVPVQFELFESGNRSNGSLNSSLEYTCCNSDTASTDSLFDWNGDGVGTQEENMGIASVIYENAIPGTFDKVRAYITDPENQDQALFVDEITILTKATEEQVSSLFTFAIPETIYMTDNDSIYCDTTYAIARDVDGQSLKDIPVQFSLDSDDFEYGYISTNNTQTDTLFVGAALQIIGAKTVFCTWPNVDIEEDTVIVNIEASINNASVNPSSVDIFLIEDLPDCPDCQASLSLSSEYYELPAEDNSVFTTTITATVIDSTENPVPQFSLVEFQSITQNEAGDWVQIGNIEPYKYTDSNGQATATFNMGNDVGLASIIGFAPQYNLADTIYVSLYSTSASSMEIVQPFPNEITVQGGGGIESTELNVNVKDGNGNLVSEPFLVKFEIQTNAPNGVYLNEIDDNNFVECVESSNGVATVTLNSGNQPGSVPIRVELYDIQTLSDAGLSCSDLSTGAYTAYGITSAEAIPVTVVTGPPSFGQINYSYVDISPIGGGLYQVPMSVHLWDFYSNPVADSTNVYIWIEGVSEIWSADSTYAVGDTVKYGDLDINGNPVIIDSLLYECIATPLFSGLPPNNILMDSYWNPVPHPGAVDGEAKTGMLAPDNNSYPGVAWSNVYYGTSDIFAATVVKALTYDSDGNKLVVDSRQSHNNENLILPFQPGALTVGSSVQFWDFSIFGDVGINDLDDTVAVNIQAGLTDYYQYPVADGDVLINAPGANVWAVCDPGDTDGDGYVGECWEDTNGSGALEIPPQFGADTQNNDLGLTCSICTANGGFWNYDDSDTGSFNQNDGDGVPDDDPSYGRTNGDGQIVWLISYSEALNTAEGENPETYNDFTSTVSLQLLDPLQTSSDGIDILLTKSEQND